MNAEEYLRLEQIETEHWFYRGKRDAVRAWIARCGPLKPGGLLVDCGAGTGRFVAEILAAGAWTAVAVDDHRESLEIALRLLSPEAVREGGLAALPFEDAAVDVVTALDVIEHVDDDSGGLAEIHRILKPRGLLVLTVPALMSLWSDWDEVLHHKRRYDMRNLAVLLRESGFEILECRYVNGMVLPLVWAMRMARKAGWAGRGGVRAEDWLPPPVLNRMLHRIYMMEATSPHWRMPLGVGLLACARRL